MSKAQYGKKVIKAVIYHRACRVCKWWKRNRPGETMRKHKCVKNHIGSARAMESASGVEGIQQLAKEGTPVEILEGDGDNTLVARLKDKLAISIKKKFDRNHVVKNIGKSLYQLPSKKVKISKHTIEHIKKCVKYAFAKNQGNPAELKANLEALIPHQFGQHTKCKPSWCGFVRSKDVIYKHRSLPYKLPLKDQALKVALEEIFAPIINRADVYSNLGSSQQCEHANKEVMLKFNKHIHFGESDALDFRVKAASACINEGRHYLSEVLNSNKYQLLLFVLNLLLKFIFVVLLFIHFSYCHIALICCLQ